MEGNIIERDEDGIKELMSVPSVGYLTACSLYDNGYEDLSQLEGVSTEELESIESIGNALAQRILQDIEDGNLGSGEFIEEIKCPECKNIIDSSREACYECGKAFTFDDTGIILPEGEIVKKPMEKLNELEKKIIDGRDDEKVWYAKAAIYESMDSLRAAYDAYDKVIEFNPLYDQIWNAKARLATKLGLFDEAARAYKIAVDFRSEGLAHQTVEAGLDTKAVEQDEEESKPIKEQDIDVKEVEDEISKARKIVTEFDKDTIGIESLQNEMDIAVKARNKDDREEAIDNARSVVKKGIILGQLNEILDDINTKLSVISEDQDSEMYKGQYQKIRSFAEDGKLKKSLSYAEILIEKLEKVPTDKSLEMKQRFEKKFESAKNKLGEARETKIDIDNIKGLIKDASDFAKEGEYEKGIAIAERAKEKSSIVISVGNKLLDIKELFVEMKDKGLDYSEYKEDILSVRDKAKEGDYEEAEDMMDHSLEKIKGELEGGAELKGEVEEGAVVEERMVEEEVEKEEGIEEGVGETVEEEEIEAELEGGVEVEKEVGIEEGVGETVEEEEIEAELEGGVEVEKEVGIEEGVGETVEEEETEAELEGGVEVEKEVRGEVEEKDKIELENTFLSRYQEMKESYNDIKSSKIKITPLKKDIKEVIQDKKEGNYEVGLEKIDYIQGKIETVKDVNFLLKTCAEKVNSIKKEGGDYKGYIDQIRDLMRKGAEGDYEAIKEGLQTLEKEIDQERERVGGEREVEDDLEVEEEGKVDEIDIEGGVSPEEVEGLEEAGSEETEVDGEEREEPESETTEEEYSMKDLTNRIKKIKNLIVTARNHGIEVEKGGSMINQAMLKAKNEEFSQAIDILDDAREWITGEMEKNIGEKIQAVREKIERGEEGESRSMAESFLEDALKAEGEGDLIKVFNLLAKADVKAEEAKGEEEKLMDDIEKMQDMVEQTRKLGIELEDSENMIHKALNKVQEGDVEIGREYLKEAKTLTEELISEDLDSIFREAQNEIKNAKISGKNVSKPVYLIKKAKEARKEGDMDDCVIYLNDYKEEMKGLE